jgi:hypothetical protein
MLAASPTFDPIAAPGAAPTTAPPGRPAEGGGVTDLAGHPAVSVAIDVDGPLHERNELLLEPATGRLLGARRVQTRRVPGWRVPAGTVLDERVFLEASVVDSRTTRP